MTALRSAASTPTLEYAAEMKAADLLRKRRLAVAYWRGKIQPDEPPATGPSYVSQRRRFG